MSKWDQSVCVKLYVARGGCGKWYVMIGSDDVSWEVAGPYDTKTRAVARMYDHKRDGLALRDFCKRYVVSRYARHANPLPAE